MHSLNCRNLLFLWWKIFWKSQVNNEIWAQVLGFHGPRSTLRATKKPYRRWLFHGLSSNTSQGARFDVWGVILKMDSRENSFWANAPIFFSPLRGGTGPGSGLKSQTSKFGLTLKQLGLLKTFLLSSRAPLRAQLKWSICMKTQFLQLFPSMKHFSASWKQALRRNKCSGFAWVLLGKAWARLGLERVRLVLPEADSGGGRI